MNANLPLCFSSPSQNPLHVFFSSPHHPNFIYLNASSILIFSMKLKKNSIVLTEHPKKIDKTMRFDIKI